MTGDELAARLYAEQGYLLVGTVLQLGIGEIIPHKAQSPNDVVNTPLRVVGRATRTQYILQDQLAQRLAGLEYHPDRDFDNYYRVEAAD